jgi:hypothetical protein
MPQTLYSRSEFHPENMPAGTFELDFNNIETYEEAELRLLTSSPVYAQALTREKQKHCLCISRIQIIR